MMASSSTAVQYRVFPSGITGYIGGTVIQNLLSLSSLPTHITALVRDPKKAELIKHLEPPTGVTIDPQSAGSRILTSLLRRPMSMILCSRLRTRTIYLGWRRCWRG